MGLLFGITDIYTLPLFKSIVLLRLELPLQNPCRHSVVPRVSRAGARLKSCARGPFDTRWTRMPKRILIIDDMHLAAEKAVLVALRDLESSMRRPINTRLSCMCPTVLRFLELSRESSEGQSCFCHVNICLSHIILNYI